MLSFFHRGMIHVCNDPQKREGQTLLVCTLIAVFNQAFKSVLCSQKVFLQLPQASTPELTAERNLEVEDIPTKHRTCAATALVIVARLRQRNVAPDRR